MKKKNILIAILCVTILLLVPLSNVSGASVGGINTKVEIVEESNPVIPYHMFEEMVELINQLLEEGKDIPYVVDMCNDALEMINPIIQKEIFEGICGVTVILFWTFGIGGIVLILLSYFYQNTGQQVLAQLFAGLGATCEVIMALNLGIGLIFLCLWAWEFLAQENNLFMNGIGLNPQINLESFSEYDITIIQEFIQSYDLNCYPCMYE